MSIAFAPPHITDEDIAAVVEVLRSGWITTGPRAAAFEQALADFCGTPRAKVVNSGGAALELALRLLGVGAGDEVVTSAYTYAATVNAIIHTGATPVLVDTAPASYLIDPEAVAARLSPRTRAVIAVDIGGVPCDYDALVAAAQGGTGFVPASPIQEAIGRVAVIADAAHSLGATRHGVPTARMADFTAYSFHAVKNLTTGEGGALTWSTATAGLVPDLHATASFLSVHGQSRDALQKTQAGGWEYDVLTPGYKWNMPDIAAALGLSQLRRYHQTLARRHQLADHYTQALTPSGLGLPQHRTEDHTSSAHLYMVDLRGGGEQLRNTLIATLAAGGVASNVHFKPLPLMTAFRSLGEPALICPHALAAYQNELSLPLHVSMSDDDVHLVADSVQAGLRACARTA